MEMSPYNTVPSTGAYGTSVATINTNFELVWNDIALMQNASIKCKGLFTTETALNTAWPTPQVGDWAGVGNGVPCQLWVCKEPKIWVQDGTFTGTLVEFMKYATKSDLAIVSGQLSAMDATMHSLFATEQEARDAAVLAEKIRALQAEQSIKSLLNASIDYAALPNLPITDLATYGHPTRHVVTRKKDDKTYVIGILDTFASGDGNQIVQVLKTRCNLNDDGSINPDSTNAEVQEYERSIIVDMSQWYKDNRTTDNGVTIDTDTYTKAEVDNAILQMRDGLETVLSGKADKSSVKTDVLSEIATMKNEILGEVEISESVQQGISNQMTALQNAVSDDVQQKVDTISGDYARNYWTRSEQADFEVNVIREISEAVLLKSDNKYLSLEAAAQNYAEKTDVYTKKETNVHMYTKDEVDDKLLTKANVNDLSSYYTKREADSAFVAKTSTDHGSASDEEQKP